MNVGVISWNFPTPRHPFNGIFIREEVDRLTEHASMRVMAPLPNQFWFGGPHSEISPLGYPILRPFTLGFPTWFFQPLFAECMAATLFLHRGFFSGCDILHVNHAFPDVVAVMRAFGGKYPVVATVHGSDVNINAMDPRLQPGIRRALSAVDRVICVSGSLAARLREIGVSSELTVIPNSVDTRMFRPGDRREACALLGLDPDRPRLLFAGNFVPVKGIEYLVRAMPDILASSPECELVLLGARPGETDAQKYRELARSLGVEHAVRFQEKVPHPVLPVWMRAANLFVLPSLREGFGIVAGEALSCGVPVVATRSGGPEDILEDGLGLLVPPGDSGALAEAVIRGLAREGISTPDVLVESVDRRFSPAIVTRRILEVYTAVLDRWGRDGRRTHGERL